MARALAIHIALFVLFGILLPLRKGLEFFDPVILFSYPSLSMVFAAPAAGQAFESARPSLSEALARILAAVLYGEAFALSILGSGILTVYWTHRQGAFFPPDVGSLLSGIGLGVSLALALSAAATWISIRVSPGAATALLRVFFALLLGAFYFRSHWLPAIAARTTAIALVAAAGLLLALWLTLARTENRIDEPGAEHHS
jgi:hypothetical protein